jgi:hypothetical protein
VALLEHLADLVDRVVLLAQLDDEVTGRRFLGLSLGAVAWREEKDRLGIPPEVVAEDVKGIEGITEGAGDLFGGALFEQISAEGFILAVFGQVGFEEELAEFT